MARNVLSLDSSIIYRSSQKHFDRVFGNYGLGYASSIFLTFIYENEGITMNELANTGDFDKATITRSMQKLQDLGYVEVQTSKEDKRQKNLFTTAKANAIIPNIYLARQSWWDYLLQDVSDEDLSQYQAVNDKISKRAKEYEIADREADVKFFGLQKLTLLDYPGLMASTLFTGGCNLRCPFCHNRGLVFLDEDDSELDKDDILTFLESRKKILDGVCISGGEPLLHPGLKGFIKKIKALGLKVKLDTNGSQYDALADLIDEKIIDYVAMDVKNSKERYGETCGLATIDLSGIEKSVELLKSNVIDYEFRTTVVAEFHDLDSIAAMGKWLKGAKRLYLQNFEDGPHCIMPGLHAHDKDTLVEMQNILKQYIEDVEIRGIE